MKVLIIDSKSYGVINIMQAMAKIGWEYDVLHLNIAGKRKAPETQEQLLFKLNNERFDIVFSFNYFVVVAECCHNIGIPYVSWIYDSPLLSLYSYTMIYDTNYVFLFDYAQYEEFTNIGLKQVYYLPLASNTVEHGITKSERTREISFVGTLYNDIRNNLYAKLEKMKPYARGYMDALIDAQKNIYGTYLLRSGINNELLNELQRVCPYIDNNSEGVESALNVYADYFLARRVTSLERIEVIQRLMKDHIFYLYSDCRMENNDNLRQFGRVDYYSEMPQVFRESMLNLNITLKSIRTGIPLRCLDIMGTASFLLTNYQVEMEQYFVAGEEYDYYGSMEELCDKATYYLEHDEVREKIARRGYEKIKKAFLYKDRLKEIEGIIKG